MLIYDFFYILIKGTFHQGLIYVLLGTSDLFGKCWENRLGVTCPRLISVCITMVKGVCLKNIRNLQNLTEINTQWRKPHSGQVTTTFVPINFHNEMAKILSSEKLIMESKARREKKHTSFHQLSDLCVLYPGLWKLIE